jgi:hypothetical protein
MMSMGKLIDGNGYNYYSKYESDPTGRVLRYLKQATYIEGPVGPRFVDLQAYNDECRVLQANTDASIQSIMERYYAKGTPMGITNARFYTDAPLWFKNNPWSIGILNARNAYAYVGHGHTPKGRWTDGGFVFDWHDMMDTLIKLHHCKGAFVVLFRSDIIASGKGIDVYYRTHDTVVYRNMVSGIVHQRYVTDGKMLGRINLDTLRGRCFYDPVWCGDAATGHYIDTFKWL